MMCYIMLKKSVEQKKNGETENSSLFHFDRRIKNQLIKCVWSLLG